MKSETKTERNNKIVSIIFLVTLFLSLFMISTTKAVEKETYSFIAKWGYTGSDEGQFNSPTGIAVDSTGNVFVVDAGNNRIQKFSNDGTFLLQWGSNGTEDGQFNYTYYDSKYNRTVVSSAGVAIDNADNVYVTDIYNNRIQKFSNTGIFLTKWVNDDLNEKILPTDITVDPTGIIYIFNGSQILKLVNESWQIFWNEPILSDGPAGGLGDIAVDNAGYIYVLDNSMHTGTGTIRKFDSNGVLMNSWRAGSYESPGDSYPTSLAVDDVGFIYLTGEGDYGEQSPALEHFKSTGNIVSGVTKFTNNGNVVTWWGNPGTDGRSSSGDGQFYSLNSIVVDSLGNVFVVDSILNRVQKFAKVSDSSVRGNWFFDENQGAIAYDNSIYHNNGLIYGASWISGVSGSALNFDGIDDYVSIPDSESLKPQQFTVKAWVKLKGDGTYHFDSSPLTKGWEVLACSFTNSLTPQAFFGLKFIGDETWTTLTSTETFPLDRWLPVVYMYDGYFMKIYVNGEEKASLTKIGTIDWSDDELFFGANNWGGYDYSIIDEIKIYDRAYPYPAEKIVTETIRPWWQISLTDDGLINTRLINERNTDYDTTYLSVVNSEDYSFILDNLTILPFITAYYNYLSNYQISSVTVNVVAKNVGIQSSFLNLEIETWGEKHTSPNIEILANQGYKTISYTWNYNPATNLNWTKNEVDDLHAGFSVQTNSEVRITQLYVTVKIPWIEMTQNLISNGDFSYNFTSRWKNYSLPWYLVIYDPNNEGYSGTLTTTSDAYEGNYSGLFNVTNRSTSNTGYIIARTGISSYSYSTGTLIGKMLKLEFYYKGSMLVYPNVYCFNVLYSSGYLSEKKLLQVFSGPECLPTDSWTYASMIFGPIPTGTTSTEIHFDVSTTGEFYFDNVNVTKITTIDYPWIS